MTTVSMAIATATRADRERIFAVLSRAFDADPVMRWMYPDPHQYLQWFPQLLQALGGSAFDHGTVTYTADYTGAALWLPPGVHLDEEAAVSLLQASIPEPRQAEIFAFFEQVQGYHPSESVWYLPVIGVEPSHHGQGYGSALLQHTLARCDQEGQAAYLEASSERSKRLYERYGFEAVGAIQVGTAPPLWPMLRPPR